MSGRASSYTCGAQSKRKVFQTSNEIMRWGKSSGALRRVGRKSEGYQYLILFVMIFSQHKLTWVMWQSPLFILSNLLFELTECSSKRAAFLNKTQTHHQGLLIPSVMKVKCFECGVAINRCGRGTGANEEARGSTQHLLHASACPRTHTPLVCCLLFKNIVFWTFLCTNDLT